MIMPIAWRSRCLKNLKRFLGSAESPAMAGLPKGASASSGGKRKKSVRSKVFALLSMVSEQSRVLRAEAIDMIPGERLEKALGSSIKPGMSEMEGCLPALHKAVGCLAILTRALDRLRDELVDGNDAEWVGMQTEFCFQGLGISGITVSKFARRERS